MNGCNWCINVPRVVADEQEMLIKKLTQTFVNQIDELQVADIRNMRKSTKLKIRVGSAEYIQC